MRTALDGKLVPGQFVVVTPHHWTEERCGVELKDPRGQTRYKVSWVVDLPHSLVVYQGIDFCALSIVLSMSGCHSVTLFIVPWWYKNICRNLISFSNIKHLYTRAGLMLTCLVRPGPRTDCDNVSDHWRLSQPSVEPRVTSFLFLTNLSHLGIRQEKARPVLARC